MSSAGDPPQRRKSFDCVDDDILSAVDAPSGMLEALNAGSDGRGGDGGGTGEAREASPPPPDARGRLPPQERRNPRLAGSEGGIGGGRERRTRRRRARSIDPSGRIDAMVNQADQAQSTRDFSRGHHADRGGGGGDDQPRRRKSFDGASDLLHLIDAPVMGDVGDSALGGGGGASNILQEEIARRRASQDADFQIAQQQHQHRSASMDMAPPGGADAMDPHAWRSYVSSELDRGRPGQGQAQGDPTNPSQNAPSSEWCDDPYSTVGNDLEVEIELPLKNNEGGASSNFGGNASVSSDDVMLRGGDADAASRASSQDLTGLIEKAWGNMEMEERRRAQESASADQGAGVWDRLRDKLTATHEAYDDYDLDDAVDPYATTTPVGTVGAGQEQSSRSLRNSVVSRMREKFVSATGGAAGAQKKRDSPSHQGGGFGGWGGGGHHDDGGGQGGGGGVSAFANRFANKIGPAGLKRGGTSAHHGDEERRTSIMLDNSLSTTGRSNLAPRRNSKTGMDALNIPDFDYDDIYGVDVHSRGGGFGGWRRTLGTAVSRCGDKCCSLPARGVVAVCAVVAMSAAVAVVVAMDAAGGTAETQIAGLAHSPGGGGNNEAPPPEPTVKSAPGGTSQGGGGVGVGGGPELDRLDAVRSLLLTEKVTSGELLMTPSPDEEDGGASLLTPQRRALEWVAYADPFSADPAGPDDEKAALVERYALATLFYATGGEAKEDEAAPQMRRRDERRVEGDENQDEDEVGEGGTWVNVDGWLSGRDACEWRGVSCEGNSITALRVTENGLECPQLPWREISKGLPELKVLDLSENSINGTLPAEPELFNNLVALHMMSNDMIGTLPTDLGRMTNLESLVLSDNLFSGAIPTELGNMESLRELALDENILSGDIPDALGALGELTVLDLSDNDLKSSIPGALSGLKKLTDLRLSDNALTGSIPPEIVRLHDLHRLYLDGNSLTSTIPSEFNIDDKAALKDLQLHDNMLTGTLPESLSWLHQLETLYLDQNDLEGTIPKQMQMMRSLRRLALDNNRLSGPIPAELAQFQMPLEILSLHHNQLTGSLPRQLSALSKLKEVEVENNLLEGTLSSSYGRLTDLEKLSLHGNSFTGVIPDDVCSLTNNKLTSLTADCAADGTVKCHCCHECYRRNVQDISMMASMEKPSAP